MFDVGVYALMFCVSCCLCSISVFVHLVFVSVLKCWCTNVDVYVAVYAPMWVLSCRCIFVVYAPVLVLM